MIEETFPSAQALEEALAPDLGSSPELRGLAPEELAIGFKILPVVQEAARRHEAAKAARAYSAEIDKFRIEATETLKTERDRLTKALTPPTSADLEKLLTQEYKEFTVQLRVRPDSTGNTVRCFVLREHPQAVEKKWVKAISSQLLPLLKQAQSLDWSVGSSADKIQSVIDSIPGALDTLAQLCAICLDPWGDSKIDQLWVQENLSTTRMSDILQAQFEVSRLRDFFSGASRLTSTIA